MKPITIHYVDDDQDDLEYFKFAVDQLNSNIILHVYNNGDAFLKSCRKNADDDPLIFLDINMPVKTGFDILKDIRSNAELKDLPVIMYSTTSDANAISVSKELGASVYAVKPVDITLVTDLISRIIGMEWDQQKLSQQNFVIN